MKVIAKVLDVTARSYSKDGQRKQACDIVFKSGTDTMQATLFDRDVTEGKHRLYEQLVGKECVVDLSTDVYRGQLQYRVGNDDPRAVGPKAADTKAA